MDSKRKATGRDGPRSRADDEEGNWSKELPTICPLSSEERQAKG